MSAKNSALVIVAATAAALALLAVCMVALWPVLRDSSPDSPAVPTTPHAPSPPAATAQSASHEYPPIAIPRATIRPAAADSSPADAAPQNAGDVPLNSNMPSGLASVTSSRIVRTLPLSDDQRFLIEEFEQQFEPHATQRLAATSAIMRQATDRVRAAGQLQRQSNSADDNVPTQDEWLKLRESLAVHRQVINILEQEYLDGVRHILNESQYGDLTSKLGSQPHVSGLVIMKSGQSPAQVQELSQEE